VLKILLNAGKSPTYYKEFAYDLFLILILIIYVKIAMTWRQSAGVLRRNIHTSEASQRLHAGDLAFRRTKTTKNEIDPYYITGFSDGEASFHISILKHSSYKLGYHVLPIFTIQLHYKDLALLELIKLYFNVGKVSLKKNKTNTTVIYTVQSIKDLCNVIIPHFDKYSLLTKKKADFILFKQIINLMVQGKHLTCEGFREIISLKASMNNGLNENLKQEFPDIIHIPRLEVVSSLIPFNLQ
jgi:hypothetical protein